MTIVDLLRPSVRVFTASRRTVIMPADLPSAETSSLRFDVGRPDHLAPLLCFFADELAEVGGRARKRRRTQIGEPCLYLGFGKSNAYLLVQFVDNFERRVLWCGYAEPITGLETRDELTDGRYLWQNVRTHSCGHCQRP